MKELHFMVRATKSKKIMACIVGVPKKYMINGRNLKMVEVNFLAVHHSLREKRLAQIIIQEMMRRKRMYGFPQAFYTSGHSKPTPFTTSHYLNRFLNPAKLCQIKYTNCPQGMDLKTFEKRYRLPDKKGINIEGTVR